MSQETAIRMSILLVVEKNGLCGDDLAARFRIGWLSLLGGKDLRAEPEGGVHHRISMAVDEEVDVLCVDAGLLQSLHDGRKEVAAIREGKGEVSEASFVTEVVADEIVAQVDYCRKDETLSNGSITKLPYAY
jgi:hypothetical protein